MTSPNDRLLRAVQNNDVNEARQALDEGADPNHAEVSGYRTTPALFTACKLKNLAMVRLLLERGAQADSGDSESAPWGSDSTPNLYIACPDVEIMRSLLEKGASPNAAGHSRDDVMTTYPLRDHGSMTAEIEALLRQFGARSPRMERFDVHEYRSLRSSPSAVVAGQALRRAAQGEAVPVTGQLVRLVPVTRYSSEEWEREIRRGERLEKADSRAAKYERLAKTQEGGRFRFGGVSAGDYFLICRIEEKPSAGPADQPVVLAARVTVRENEPLEVILTEVAPRTISSAKGTAIVEGVASARTPTGTLAVAAQRSVYLVPVTEQSEELWQRVAKRELQPAPDPEGMLFEQRTAADEAGRFRFERVSAGDYYACCRIELVWEEPLELAGRPITGVLHQKVLLGARISVQGGETKTVHLERIG